MRPERILVGSVPTLSASFYDDGPQDVGAVTVHVWRRSDGTDVLPVNTPANKGADPVKYTVDLPAAGAARLDELTAVWTAASGRQVTTTVEVVGGFLFEIHELRSEPDVGSADKYPNEALRDVRTVVEDLFESYCKVAFVPRLAFADLRGTGSYELRLRGRRIRSIESVVVDDVTITGYQTYSTGTVASPAYLPRGSAITVAYTHGMDAPPADVHDAALMYARHRLIDRANRKLSNVRSRIRDGGDVELLSTPDPDRGRPTGLLDVDAILNRYRDDTPAIA